MVKVTGIREMGYHAKTLAEQRLYYCRQVQVQVCPASASAVLQFWACALPCLASPRLDSTLTTAISFTT